MNVWDELKKHRDTMYYRPESGALLDRAIARGRALEQALNVASEALRVLGIAADMERGALQKKAVGRIAREALAEIRRMEAGE